MARSFNSLKASDVIVTPIRLKYSQSYDSASASSGGIQFLTGSNGTTSPTGSYPQDFLLYRSVRNSFYMNYLSGSLLQSASYFDWSPQSTAASGTLDDDNRYFPTESTAKITVVSIPRSQFGEQISRTSFYLDITGTILTDDGNGNIIHGTTHVGNIIYAQGTVIITNPNYYSLVYSGLSGASSTTTYYVNKVTSSFGAIDDSTELNLIGQTSTKTTFGGSYSDFTNIDYISYDGPYTGQITLDASSATRAGVVIFDSNLITNYNPSYIGDYVKFGTPSFTHTFTNTSMAQNTPTSSIIEYYLVPASRNGLVVNFNHFDTTLNPNATIQITGSVSNTVWFNKTIADIISDNVYSYAIPSVTDSNLIVNVNNVTHSNASNSYISTICQTGASAWNYSIGNLGSVNSSIIYTALFPKNVNIQLDYPTASVSSMAFQAETTLYQNKVICHINENDFNYSNNPSMIVSGSTPGLMNNNVTGSDFNPYATTVGLYNDANELLVVGKLAAPFPVPRNTDVSFIIQWDS